MRAQDNHGVGEAAAPAESVWHALTAAECAAQVGGDLAQGLNAADAGERRIRFGPNRLPEARRPSAFSLFLAQLRSGLILVLAGAAGLAAVAGSYRDAAVILAVVALNATLGFVQERRAERSLAALERMITPRCRVRRGGRTVEVAAAELVPGDLLLLEAGERVAADGRLVRAHALEIDESALTGESEPSPKNAEAVLDPDAPLAERQNLCFQGSLVTRGRGEAIVCATGARSEMGRVARLLGEVRREPTPLQRELDALGKKLGAIALLVALVVVAAELGRGSALVDTLLVAMALGIAAMPEGLPAVVTVTLALGMRRMAGRGAIVKRLASVETLGATTVICTDKTGTLTLNRMTVRALRAGGRWLAVRGEGTAQGGAVIPANERGEPVGEPLAPTDLPEALRLFALAAALCGDARLHNREVIGDPTEGALVVLAAKLGLARRDAEASHPRVAEIPFDPATKRMVTFHGVPEGFRVFVKGAPEVILPHCATVLGWDGPTPVALDDGARAAVLADNALLAQRGLRVLALATKLLTAGELAPEALAAQVSGLCLLGLAGSQDPLRPEAKEAIASCRRSGISVKMVTGDQPATAAAIARELDLPGEVLTAADVSRLDDRALGERAAAAGVFARATPELKTRIVAALRARGEVVAMTGDGVNDAPALRRADIGVAMGKSGTAVSQEAATLVLTDDRFATIVRAVQEGRTIYANIVHFVRFQVATNIGAILTVLAAPFLGLPTPFHAIQLLWINIIMDGPPALALGVDPPGPGLMEAPPRGSGAAILSWRRLARLAGVGAVMAVGTLAMLYYALEAGGEAHARTMAFTTFVLFQVFNALAVRAEADSVFTRHLFANRRLWAALGVVLALQIAATTWAPAMEVLRTTPLGAGEWALALAVASVALWTGEAARMLRRRRRRD